MRGWENLEGQRTLFRLFLFLEFLPFRDGNAPIVADHPPRLAPVIDHGLRAPLLARSCAPEMPGADSEQGNFWLDYA